jgi:hypothetical protein
VGDRSGSVDVEAEAGGGDERAPLSGGAARWLTAEAREEAATQRRSGGNHGMGRGGFRLAVAGCPF